jgi:hypothetical protein
MDLVAVWLILSPAFLAVVIWTFVRGETFGAGQTVCAGLIAITAILLLRARRAGL